MTVRTSYRLVHYQILMRCTITTQPYKCADNHDEAAPEILCSVNFGRCRSMVGFVSRLFHNEFLYVVHSVAMYKLHVHLTRVWIRFLWLKLFVTAERL